MCTKWDMQEMNMTMRDERKEKKTLYTWKERNSGPNIYKK